jgi:uncharacterized membrane protein YesL
MSLVGRLSPKGTAGLLIAIGIVVVLLIAFPPYRLFFLISLGIAVLVAGILHWWNSAHPIEEKDVPNNKRPLGLD